MRDPCRYYSGGGRWVSLGITSVLFLVVHACPVPMCRHVYLVGPKLWRWWVVMEQVSTVVMLRIVCSQTCSDSEWGAMTVYTTSVFIPMSICGGILAWKTMDKQFHKTFLTNTTLLQHVRDQLWNQRNYKHPGCTMDETRSAVIETFAEDYWPKDKLRDWLVIRWDAWAQHPPEWLTKQFLELIPVKLLPPRAAATLSSIQISQASRRSSNGTIDEDEGEGEGEGEGSLSLSLRKPTAGPTASHVASTLMNCVNNNTTPAEACDAFVHAKPFKGNRITTIECVAIIRQVAVETKSIAHFGNIGLTLRIVVTAVVCYPKCCSLGLVIVKSSLPSAIVHLVVKFGPWARPTVQLGFFVRRLQADCWGSNFGHNCNRYVLLFVSISTIHCFS